MAAAVLGPLGSAGLQQCAVAEPDGLRVDAGTAPRGAERA